MHVISGLFFVYLIISKAENKIFEINYIELLPKKVFEKSTITLLTSLLYVELVMF